MAIFFRNELNNKIFKKSTNNKKLDAAYNNTIVPLPDVEKSRPIS